MKPAISVLHPPICVSTQTGTLLGGEGMLRGGGELVTHVFAEVDRLAQPLLEKAHFAWHKNQYLGGCCSQANCLLPSTTPLKPATLLSVDPKSLSTVGLT